MRILFLFLAITLAGCQGYQYNQDNIIEEAAELGLDAWMGVDVDLSPATPENGFSPQAILPVEKIGP